MEVSKARAILEDGAGSQWDASIIEALFRILDTRAMNEVGSRSDWLPADFRAA